MVVPSPEAWDKLIHWYPDDEHGGIFVYRVCPNCGKFITKGEVYVNQVGDVRLDFWHCKTCGIVQPHWEREA